MMILLNNDGGERHSEWRESLNAVLPDHMIYDYPDIPDRSLIEYAVVWNHPKGDLRRYPNLKAVLSMGAGTEHFDLDPTPPLAPIYRMIDPVMAEDMALYALYWIIHTQRHFDVYRAQQAERIWDRLPQVEAKNVQVVILGLGAIGSYIAERIARNGYTVSGWSRHTKSLNSVTSLTGEATLIKALGQADIVINCLPLNRYTRGFWGRDKFSALKNGATFVNMARGPLVDNQALMQSLDNGPLGLAVLDVFDTEPLEDRSALWGHPKIKITPHMSGMTNPQSAGRLIGSYIQMIENGETPPYPYKRAP